MSAKFKSFNHRFILALLVGVGAVRLLLLDRGALAAPDEGLYLRSLAALEHLVGGRPGAFCVALYETKDRPGQALVNLVPAAVQLALRGGLGLATDDSLSLLAPCMFNTLVSLGVLFMVWRVTGLLFPNDRSAPNLAALAFGLLGSSTWHVRHLLPYDASLLVSLAVLHGVLRSRQRSPGHRSAVLAGIGAAFAFSIYPGYYWFPVILLSMVLRRAAQAGRPAPAALAFALGATAVLSLHELVSRVAGRSYVRDSLQMSSTITQGTFAEGFTFPVKYLVEMETAAGLLLLLLATVWIAREAARLVGRAAPEAGDGVASADLRLLVGVALVGLTAHGALSALAHKMVFSGRLVHMWVPFLIWMALGAVVAVRGARTRRLLEATWAAAAAGSFAWFLWGFAPLAYPRDVLRAEAGLIASAPIAQRRAVFESRYSPGFDDSAVRALQLPADPLHLDPRRRVTLVNFGYFYPLYPDDHRPYAPGPGERLAYRRLHWLNHPAYYLEGYSVEERRLLRQRRYHVQLWVGKTEDIE